MAKVADLLWEMLQNAGVKRCYGIVGDALNPVIDALRRNGNVEFVHVRNEEYGVFAAVAESYLTGYPVAVCGTAGPGVTHLFNGLMDARKERASVIAIAGDIESKLIDTSALEELNPYKFFDAAALYIGRVVNPEQARSVFNTAITTSVIDRGPTVISLCGDVAASDALGEFHPVAIPSKPVLRPAEADLEKLAQMINDARTVAIFGGEGCRDARTEVLSLANKLKATVGYSFLRQAMARARSNPHATGMTGLIGYGGTYKANHGADLLLMLGTDFPFSEFLTDCRVKKVQIDTNPKHLGRRTPLDLGLVGDVQSTLAALLPKVREKNDTSFLEKHVSETREFDELLNHYVDKGPGIKPIRPEYLAATLSAGGFLRRDVFRRHRDSLHLAGPPYQGRRESPSLRLLFLGIDGQRRTKCIRRAVGLSRSSNHCPLWRWWFHDARPRRFANPCATQVTRRARHSQQ